MTQTLIEQLEKLPRTHMYNHERQSGSDEAVCTYVKLSDLRAIIEQHKQEAAEPFCYLCDWGDHNGLHRVAVYYGELGSAIADDWNEFPKVHRNLPLYRTTQPDIIAELVKALEDDAYAASFQSMAVYRNALIAKVKEIGE